MMGSALAFSSIYAFSLPRVEYTACTTQRVAWPRPVQVESVRMRSLAVGERPVEMTERDRPSRRNASRRYASPSVETSQAA